ncbi:YARHG domain-containing protein [Pedobacter sp. KR3-3]|uniref:YARHG domain-containing protein n=1 Tax=Pedobacter albus TaxID=3113905 RepID=A0ABU7ICQ3_9SPHI|nr:YARHG domain-containing protein [Pedobacter sp. KR3-3]MEE1947137.1 YARHG domain-containing protein [Pedobacter sp. KR3-3]
MKKLCFLVLSIAIYCTACQNKDQKTTSAEQSATAPKLEHQNLNGFWVGDFIAEEYKEDETFHVSNKINLAIKSIVNGVVTAQSIVAGNKRPLTGKMTERNGRIIFNLAEPGDNKYDGRFEFELVKDTLVGTWTAYDTTLPVTKRSFKLTPKEFSYNPNVMLSGENDYIDYYSSQTKTRVDTVEGVVDTLKDNYYRQANNIVYTVNSSTHAFTEAELKNLKKLDLEILRNTIFARHGYTFKKIGYRQFFDPVEWYVPVTDNVDVKLSAIEKANIKLFVRFEKYATDNYDTFGR